MRAFSINNKGFTLIELIVVMVLIAITASFAVPRISSFLYTDHLKVAVRKLVGLINQSSQLAQRHQVPYLLQYMESERRFIVEAEQKEDDATTTIKKEGELHLADSVTVKDLWSWYGGTRTPGEFVIRFNKNGYVEPTIIHLQEESGQEFSVVLSPFLGKVQVVDSYVNADKAATFQ
jgi:type II secretion system protein H